MIENNYVDTVIQLPPDLFFGAPIATCEYFSTLVSNQTGQQQIADLFETTRENVTMHLRNVFDEDELDPAATSTDFLQVRQEGSRTTTLT